MDNIWIEQITPELTWRLRRDVLYPKKIFFEMEMPEDFNGFHFGAFADNKLCGVISVFKQNNSVYQFRKFAVANNYQGKGIGSALLNYITNFIKEEGATQLWCNARNTAIGFYEQKGYKQQGEPFIKDNIAFVIMSKDLTAAS